MGTLSALSHSSSMRPLILGTLLLASCIPNALSRPLLLPPKRLVLPQCCDPNQQEPNFSSVAIDGDTVLASAQRSISDSERVNGVYIFQRAADGAGISRHRSPRARSSRSRCCSTRISLSSRATA